jgi:hypothetical protein
MVVVSIMMAVTLMVMMLMLGMLRSDGVILMV